MKILSIAHLRPITLSLALLPALPRASAQAPADLDALKKQALAEAQAGNGDAAARDLALALASDPTWKEGLWDLGTLQYSANRFPEAASTFTKVVQLAPDLPTAWSLLGLSEFETGDLASALTHLERANTLDASSTASDPEVRRVSTYHLALLLIHAGQFSRASDLLLQAFGNIGPSAQSLSPQVRYALGLALLRVPLLPTQINPSQEAVISAAGSLASAGPSALAQFPTFLASYPTTPYAHLAFANALEHAGRIPEALTQLREESRISPASSLVWTELSRLELKQGETAPARVAETKAHALPPSASPEQRIVSLYGNTTAGAAAPNDDLWTRAMQAYTAGQYSPAIADLKIWLATHPEMGTAWAVLGLSEFALNDLDNALIHLQRGQTLGLTGSTASLETARYTLALLLIRAGDFDPATDLLQPLASAHPDDPKFQLALGLALLRRPELPNAVAPTEAGLIVAAGPIAVLLESSKYDDAFALFHPLLDRYPTAPFLHYAYGTALLALSRFDEAAVQMRAEIVISPRSDLPLIRLASIAVRQHRPADAIPLARQALTLAPSSAEAHYLLGRASLENNDVPTAIHELELATRVSPSSPEAHFNLARAYARAQRPEAAATERATFARLNDLAEAQKSRRGSQIYAGPRQENTVSNTASPTDPPRIPNAQPRP